MAPRPKYGQPGAIVSARLRNFMTYNDTTLKPGTNLNMIIGPNGSGKSAIVCSIIVGLAGDVTLTGRATNIVDLVQKGSKWGSTEIELHNDRGRNWIIERKIIILGRNEGKIEYKNEWRMNGNLVPKRDIQELMTKLNIKVDNLCQFLPQDSVASFVKMSSGELLVKTLKAAGSNQLVEDLDKLTSLTQEITTKTRQLESLKKSSAENEVNARRLETEVEELRAREQLIAKKTICSLKVHYIRYQEALTKSDKAKDDLQNIEESLRQAQSEGDPYQQKVTFYKSEETRLRDLVHSDAENSKTLIQLLQRHKDSLERRKTECQEKYAEFKSKKDREQQRDQAIRMKQQEFDSYECRLTEIREVDYSRELDAVKSTMETVRQDIMNNKSSKDSLDSEQVNLVRQIEMETSKRSALQRIKEQKLQFMASRKKDAGAMSEWLMKNRDKFDQQVFLPMMCEINVKNQRDAPIIEHIINEADFYSFMCQRDTDLRKLTEAAQRLRAKISTFMPPEKTLEDFHVQNTSDYSNLNGFRAYLKDLIDAPEPIMRYLYGNYGFHRTPVFDDLREADLKRMVDSGCPRFYVRNKCYQTSRSRYDQATTMFNTNIRAQPRLLTHSLDKKQLDQLTKVLDQLRQKRVTLDEQIKKLNQDGDEINRRYLGLRTRHHELLQKHGEKQRIEGLIKLTRKSIEQLKEETIDMDAEKASFQAIIMNINNKMISDLEKMGKIVTNFAEIRETFCLNTLKCTLARKNYRRAERKYKDVMSSVEQLKKEIVEKKRKVQDIIADAEKAKKIAEEKITGFKNNRLDKSTKNKFATIDQDTLEDLELYEEELKARIQGMSRHAGNQILNEFNRQNEELLDKRRQITQLEAVVVRETQELQDIKTRFLPQLDDVIKVIDEHYHDFMQKLNYDGRVVLGRDTNNLDDFSKYGIDIMVKYRDNEQLIPLSSTRQSGGERSVATMIYMLALQTKTTVPFRVVDEINQGMDKDNERKVFELLVQVADESSSQYFLVSPKLLSGLNYGERMQIHVVFNGPQLRYCFDDLKTIVQGDDEAYDSAE